MDIATARTIVLADFNAEEYDHFGKLAFRHKAAKAGGKPGKTFMTLWIEEGVAVLLLDQEQQADLVAHHADAFEPHKSKWGEKGATVMHLERISEKPFREAVGIAHTGTLKKK